MGNLFDMTGLDVLRTDRTLVFYEKPENLSKLWDILAVYAWLDQDVGYCQGNSSYVCPARNRELILTLSP